MIELIKNKLIISFPEVHRDAKATIEFQRTLRIPDDDDTYPLPPGLGKFPLKHIEDYSDNIDSKMLKRGGIIMPMYQSEAVWLKFNSKYPFALKIGTGKINAVSGETWAKGLRNRVVVSEVGRGNSAHSKQDYVVTSLQPWLDGYCVEKDIIKQFVAAKMGDGATVEEQLSPETQYGGIQLEAYPLKAEKWVELEKLRIEAEKRRAERLKRLEVRRDKERMPVLACASKSMDMLGVGAGGRMKQQIYSDTYEYSDWDTSHVSRCWVHLCNSSVWEQITGTRPPLEPLSAKDYNDGGLPWFDYYKEDKAIEGSNNLKGVKGVQEILGKKDEPVDPSHVKNVTTG